MSLVAGYIVVLTSVTTSITIVIVRSYGTPLSVLAVVAPMYLALTHHMKVLEIMGNLILYTVNLLFMILPIRCAILAGKGVESIACRTHTLSPLTLITMFSLT